MLRETWFNPHTFVAVADFLMQAVVCAAVLLSGAAALYLIAEVATRA